MPDRREFEDLNAIFSDVRHETIAQLAKQAGDLVLILDMDGRIRDGSADLNSIPNLQDWIGKLWRETVTTESYIKIDAMLEAATNQTSMRPRQVNHPTQHGDLPVSYVLIELGNQKGFLAVGRDLRAAAELQQQLLQAQQSLERDYGRLRQLETRYRMLFEMSQEPVIILDHESRRVVEANPAAHSIMKAKPGNAGWSSLHVTISPKLS